jgi:GNAT superfamily N-acetyltransferase
MLPDYTIRLAQPADLPSLTEVEAAAGTRFEDVPDITGLPADAASHLIASEEFECAHKAGLLWVAATGDGTIVGFALVRELAGYAHLEELDVVPAHGSRGIGSALLEAVCSWARDTGYPGVTLRTFRDVPWNAPFYRRKGFRIVNVPQLSEAHAALERSERERGLRADLRVTMMRSPA